MPLIAWQNLLDVLTRKGHDIQGIKQVKEAKDENTKFKICYNLNKQYLLEWLNECLNESHSEKSAKESSSLRVEGNLFYKKKDYKRSLEIYNKSIIVAPYGTEEMAFALANRSAVLVQLQHFEEALNDIELAFENGYPEDKKKKLLLRKTNLLVDSKKYTDAVDLLEKMKEMSLKNSDDKLEEAVNATCLKVLDMTAKKPMNAKVESSQKPELARGESSSLKSASTKLDLKNSAEKGRFVEANRDVYKGDVLFLEKPFALIVLPDQINKHCHHCCKNLIAPIPCTECNEALYCSKKCLLDSLNLYHKWECGGLNLCHSVGIAHLGLRIALLSQTTNETARYQQVYNLLTHSEKMTGEDLYQYTLTAVLLTLYLDCRRNYFSAQHNETEVETMGGRILRHITQMICNGHAITKIDYCDDNIKSEKIIGESKQRIATAIYPSASMMNHSCDNNISNSFINENLVVRASKNIKKGEEVFNCYGPHYKHMEVQQRQEILNSQYFFTCKCNRCIVSDDVLKPYSALQCMDCKGPVFKNTSNCAECGKCEHISELMKMSLKACVIATKGSEFTSQGQHLEAIECFKESLELGQKCLYKHNFDLLHYKDQLARNYAEIGEYKKSAKYLEECLPTIEARYGSSSVALMQEYLKLIDIRCLHLQSLSANSFAPEYGAQEEQQELQGIAEKELSRHGVTFSDEVSTQKIARSLEAIQGWRPGTEV